MTITSHRRAFTIMEIVAALAILASAMVLVAQLGTWTLAERLRGREQQAALELAANVLESARARPWHELTPAWAASQRLPPSQTERHWRLSVQVAPEPERPLTKRVTVEVQIHYEHGQMPPPVQMVGLFSARSVASPGEKP
jgi:prepilin-type N-terminal cleavage/methylation domain-containing protein